MSSRIKLAVATALLFTVAACGGGGGDGVSRGLASLGLPFIAAFNADANGDPVDIKNISLTVDPSADPFNP